MRARLFVFFLVCIAPAVVRGDDGVAWPATAEPLAIGAVARRVGDHRVLAELDASRSVSRRLRAIEAAVFLREPELALPRLAELAGGRDPDLAPTAQAAAWRIARSLDPLALEAREADRAAILGTRASFETIAADEDARSDIRLGARLVVDALSHL
jgi:hypothetical protein